MADDPELLPLERRKAIQEEIVEHVRSLNRAGQLPQGVTREHALKALGFSTTEIAGVEMIAPPPPEQWLCGADNVCGVKVAAM